MNQACSVILRSRSNFSLRYHTDSRRLGLSMVHGRSSAQGSRTSWQRVIRRRILKGRYRREQRILSPFLYRPFGIFSINSLPTWSSLFLGYSDRGYSDREVYVHLPTSRPPTPTAGSSRTPTVTSLGLPAPGAASPPLSDLSLFHSPFRSMRAHPVTRLFVLLIDASGY